MTENKTELLPDVIFVSGEKSVHGYKGIWSSHEHIVNNKGLFSRIGKRIKYIRADLVETRATVTPPDKAAALEAFDYMAKNDLILVMMEYKTGVTYHTDKSIEMTGAIERAALQDHSDLIDALKPLAKVYEISGIKNRNNLDDFGIWSCSDNRAVGNTSHTLTLGDCKRAYDLLAKHKVKFQ